MNIPRISVALAGFLIAGTAGAQQAPVVERITFQQAIELALRQNAAVLQAENAVENARLSVQQAGSSIWPTFNFNVGASNSLGRQFDTQTGTLVNRQTQSANSSVGSNITLLDPNRGLDVSSARASLAASEADLFRGKQTAAYTVAQNFVAYLSAVSQLEVQKENLTSQQLQEAQIQRFADAGARPISDLYTIKAQVANAQLQVVNAERQIENAKFALMRTLQLDASKDYEFVRPDLPELATTINYNLDSLTRVAYGRRRDMTAAQERVEAALDARRSAARGQWPALSLSAGYNSSGRFGQEVSFSDQFDQNRGGSIQAGISIPFFDRGQTRIARTRAAIQEENAQLQLAQTRQTVALDVRTAWFNIRSAQQQLIAAQAGLLAATQALEATTQRYNVGAATLLDVTQARAQRVNAQSALADARYTLLLNQAAMAYFTGELEPTGLAIGR